MPHFVQTESLPEFIAQHTVEKICLPCRLVLPKAGGAGLAHVRRKPATMKEALITGAGMFELMQLLPFMSFSGFFSSPAACDLVYLGSVDVPSAGSDALLAETVQQLKSLELSTTSIVTFKASKDGITLTDTING